MSVSNKYISFFGLCLGFFVIMMDTTNVPLMYPTLMNVFHLNPAIVAWVNNVYLISYAACLLLGGRLGSFANRKNVVISAYLALGLGALVSGSDHSFTQILVGRALMGIGAGLLTPQSMAYISTLFDRGKRGMALGVWGAVAGIATAAGPVFTQIILSVSNWQLVMWMNTPVAFLCIVIAIIYLPSQPGKGYKLTDLFMASVLGGGLAISVLGLQYIGAAQLSLELIGAVLFFIGATIITLLVKKDISNKSGYLLPITLWTNKKFLQTCFISALLGAALTSFYFPLSFLLNVSMKFGPVLISILMATISLSCAIVGPFAGRLSDHAQPKKIIKLGLILFASVNVLFSALGFYFPNGGILVFGIMCFAMVISGIGAGLAFAPLANLALNYASPESVGQAAAFFNVVRQLSSAIGSVVVAISFDFVVRFQLSSHVKITAINLRTFSHVTASANLVCFLLVAVCLLFASFLARTQKKERLDYRLNTVK